MTTNRLEQLRQKQIDIRKLQSELANLAQELKAHPDKPTPGSRPSARWASVKQEVEDERSEMLLDLQDMELDLAEIKAAYTQEPVPMWSVADIIEELAAVEAEFSERTWKDAWGKLSAFIDHLEKDEARVLGIQAAQS